MNFRQLKHVVKESSWLLGICLNGYDDLVQNNIHWVSNGEYSGKKWFADPFILDYNDKTIDLLVEEFDYNVHRGRIAHITVDRSTWTVTTCTIILDLSTHLSFPAIYRVDGKIYVCPENYNSGEHDLYMYNQKEERLEFVKCLYKEKLTDTTLAEINGKWYMLSTCSPTPNGKKLTIYNSNKFDGPYDKCQEIIFNENIGRNAGQIFSYKGQMIRPAQECNKVYGHAIVFQKVCKTSDGTFAFDELTRYTSTHSEYNIGTHTYNEYKGMAVIDVKGYRCGNIARIYKAVENIFIKLGIKKPYILK